MIRRALPAVLLLLLAGCRATAPAPAPIATEGGGAAGRDVAEPALVAIGELQGSSTRSPLLDRQVSVQGVVVGDFTLGLQGVFVQSERDDGNPATAEGLFVQRDAAATPRLRVGDRVRVAGTVAEQGGASASLTALRDATVRVLGRGTVAPTVLHGAPSEVAEWERYEGMLLSISAPLTVSGNDGLAGYGEIVASFGGRLFQSTELAAPGPAADALAADNQRRRLLLDDARTNKDPRELWFLAQGLDDRHPLRAGSVLHGVSGVLDQRRGDYRLQLVEKLEATQAPRPPAPSVAGDLRIGSLNLLNLFNGDGRGGGFPTERGAETRAQYQRQQQKLVAVVQALAPDIAALMEVENDGSDAESTLGQFVAALNAAGPARDYHAVDTGRGPGTDSIRVAMIYRASRVTALGRPAFLAGGPFEGRSRVPMAQAFRAGGGPAFVVAANHFKSKGCGRDADKAQGEDADHGQGCWNEVRVDSARRLLAWLKDDPTRSRAGLHLIVGDLNAYAQEDPLALMRSAGWLDAFAGSDRPYSFVFDGKAGRLDHAMLDAGMAAHLRSAVEWHNNSDEAPAFDYHLDQEGDPYRASDHDPVLLGFDLRRQRL